MRVLLLLSGFILLVPISCLGLSSFPIVIGFLAGICFCLGVMFCLVSLILFLTRGLSDFALTLISSGYSSSLFTLPVSEIELVSSLVGILL